MKLAFSKDDTFRSDGVYPNDDVPNNKLKIEKNKKLQFSSGATCAKNRINIRIVVSFSYQAKVYK